MWGVPQVCSEMTRRGFIGGGAAMAVSGVSAAGHPGKVVPPGIPKRNVALVPAGAKGLKSFRAKCVGCQLCIRACPEKVLRPSYGSGRFLLPEMGFEHGYCRPWCTRCAEACPAGAIVAVSAEERLHMQIGRAMWHKDRCVAAKNGVICTACERHCPANAIELRDGTPVIDSSSCIGCGACENLCPARPLPAITVDGFENHRICG